MGQKGSHTCDVIFENCRVPASALIGGVEGVGFKTAMKVLDKGRLHIGAYSVGVAERMLNDALHYAIERKQFGQPIANFQLIQAMLADSKAEIYAAKCMVLDAARRRDNGENISTEASCAKMFATEMCGRVADRCVQIHGGAGYISEYAIERFYRDVRLFRLYEGTTQVQQLIIAKNMIRKLQPNKKSNAMRHGMPHVPSEDMDMTTKTVTENMSSTEAIQTPKKIWITAFIFAFYTFM